MEKVTSKNTKRALRNTNANKNTVLLRSNYVFCRILLLARHIALICSTTIKLLSGAVQGCGVEGKMSDSNSDLSKSSDSDFLTKSK